MKWSSIGNDEGGRARRHAVCSNPSGAKGERYRNKKKKQKESLLLKKEAEGKEIS